VAAAAARHGFLYLDAVETALTTKGNALCNGTGVRAGLNLIALNPKQGTAKDALNPGNWFHNSLHPKPAGHKAIESAVEPWFQQHAPLVAPSAKPESVHTVASIDELMGEATAQCAPQRAKGCQLAGDGWQHAQLTQFYRSRLGPIALALAGSWFLLAPILWYGREHHYSLLRLLGLSALLQ